LSTGVTVSAGRFVGGYAFMREDSIPRRSGANRLKAWTLPPPNWLFKNKSPQSLPRPTFVRSRSAPETLATRALPWRPARLRASPPRRIREKQSRVADAAESDNKFRSRCSVAQEKPAVRPGAEHVSHTDGRHGARALTFAAVLQKSDRPH